MMTKRLMILLAVCLMATPAAAHTGQHVAGFIHPFTGLDHLAAMIASGLLAARLGGRALWIVPLSFMAMMAAGAAAAIAGFSIPLVETAILASVVVLAGAAIFARHVPVVLACGLAGFFAIFHGHAHGAEMPADASGLIYGLGFLAATAILHGVGLLAGRVMPAVRKPA